MYSVNSILLALGEKLPDRQLKEFFPALSPSAVRSSLREAARMLADDFCVSAGEEVSSSVQNGGASGSAKLTVYTDGASRGNPGEAGAGIVILNEQGEELFASGTYLGQCTNNVAEYKALLLGLTEAKKLGGEELSLFLDSELIVRQIQGAYKVKNAKLKPLFSEVSALLSGFKAYRVAHVPRSKNKRADGLANEGIDAALTGR